MKQVLLSVAARRPTPPVVMWMGDDASLGDIFLWHGKVCTVSAIYGTTLSRYGAEVHKNDKPHYNQQAGVVLDHHAS